MSFAASAPAEPVQSANFNPSWIRSAFHGGGVSSSPRVSTNDEEETPLSMPIFVTNRYGREDLIALMGKECLPPDGLTNCTFFVEEATLPIVCFPLTDMEQRQQQNINSSKAMSQLSHAERNSIAAGGAFSGNTTPNSTRGSGSGSGWTPVKSSRGNPQTATLSNGRGGPRPFARGGARVGDSPRESEETREGYYNARFPGRGGRGGAALARGGSTTASTTFNARAQGLYDPRDPKDRPRNRLRSTSDEAETNSSGDAGWTTIGKTTWKEKENRNTWNKESASGSAWINRENSQTGWKNENHGNVPEWMEDGEKDDVPALHRPGSFDEQGAYRDQSSKQVKSTIINTVPSNERQNVPEVNAWGTNEPRKDSVPATNPNRSYHRPTPEEQVQERVRQQYVPEVPTVNAYENAMPQTLVALTSRQPMFTYLDPSKIERGPFPKEQMDAWFETGYFKDDLKVKRVGDSMYRSLGELKTINGRLAPFDYKDEVTAAPNLCSLTNQFGFGLTMGTGVWNDKITPIQYSQPMYDQMLEDQRKLMIDEELKLKEQKMLASLAKHAEEQEKAYREREAAIKKKEEDMQKKVEEERLRREREHLELSRIREKQRLEEEARKDELRQMEEKLKRNEEEIRRKAQEAAEAHKRALLQKAEEDAIKIRKQQEEARKAEEMRRAAIAAEEQKRQFAVAAAALEEHRRAVAIAEAEERRAAAAAAAKKVDPPRTWKTLPEVESRSPSLEDDGWVVQAPTKKNAAAAAAAAKGAAWSTPTAGGKSEKSLKEIQEEEERLLKLELDQKARIKKEEASSNPNIQSTGTWSNVTQRLNWNPPVGKSNSSKVAWGGAGIDCPATSPSINWDGPTLQAANKVAPAPVKKAVPAAKPAPTKPAPVVKKEATKTKTSNSGNTFNSWVVTRLKQLNESVDAEVLADFLKTVENPNDVEDYVEGYLGSSKASKEFVKEFLQKRCEMRNRKTDKDDLSSASVAPATGTSAGKKKKKGTRLVVDGSCLGFRPAADPNRVNQGTIEFVTAAPATTTGRR